MTVVDKGSLQSSIAFYSKSLLPLYDSFVHGFSNPNVWGCPTHTLIAFYTTNISERHLDIGVGTGYLLDSCSFPSLHPQLTLLDLSTHSLAFAVRRLRRYRPAACRANVLVPLPLRQTFASIGLNYVLHCLPGTFATKQIVFKHVAPLIAPGGVVFGTTILGAQSAVRQNYMTQAFLQFYNRRGAFTNLMDTQYDLEQALATHFSQYTVWSQGSVAFFTAKR